MSNITCGNCKAQHASVAEVRACYGVAPKAVVTASGNAQREVTATVATDPFGEAKPKGKPASAKQIAFLMSLQERAPEADRVSEADYAALTTKEASRAIDALMALPKPTKETKAPRAARVVEDGIYIVDATNEIFKVYVTVHGNRQQCVKRLDHIAAETVTEQPKGKFVYMGLATKHLPANARMMTLDEAKALGRVYGFCVKCGRTLTDEQSIASGIGPVCGQDGAWGRGDTTVAVPEVKPVDADACTPGQQCQDILRMCSKHAWAYQVRYGRAANE